MPRRRTLYDHTGRPVTLDRELAAGGEGVVSTVVGDPASLAKLYRKRPATSQADKLRWMVGAGSDALCRVAAWPSALLHDGPSGPVVGFLMPRLTDYQAVQHLYNPAQRRKYFPRADWSFLARTARNCAAAFEEVHQTTCVVGDVNQSNLLVSPRALVGLIDCDSFQVQFDGRSFLCEVGVAHYTPPELQGQSFRGVVRTHNHDRFGLAVVIFQLLFVGRHPYAGRYLGPGDVPFEKAIQEYRFAYGESAAALLMERPPHTPALADVSPELGRLFERAFGRGSEAPDARPTAAEWRLALERLEKQLRECPNDPGHKFPAEANACPWCTLASAGAPNYFVGVAAVVATFMLDRAKLDALWARVERVPFHAFTYDRAPLLPLQPAVPAPLPEGIKTGRTVAWLVGAIALVGMALVFGACLFDSRLVCFGVPVALFFGAWWAVQFLTAPYYREKRTRWLARELARRDLETAEADRDGVAGAYAERFGRLKHHLGELHQQAEQLPARYEAERRKLERNQKALARDAYLRACFLTDHPIPGIGPGRQQTLASYGIETAFDVTEDAIGAIKGFGPVLTGNLLEWKKQMTGQFRFDPQTGVPETELRALAFTFKQHQDKLLAQVTGDLGELEGLAGQAQRQLQALAPRLLQLVSAWSQAEANLEMFRR